MGNTFATMAAPAATKTSARTTRSQTGVEESPTEVTGLVAASDAPAKTATAIAPTETATAIAPAKTATAAKPTEKFDQCGLEDDEDLWEDAPLPQRHRQPIINEEKKKKYQALLDLIFSVATLRGKLPNLDPDLLHEVATDIIRYLKMEPMLIEDVPFPCTVVGDIHGQLYDVHRVFLKNAEDGKPGWVDHKYVFMGDYVDRGRQSIEVVVALFCIKMLYPDNIFLLRGNHEFIDVNKRYGFLEDFYNRYEHREDAQTLYYQFNKAFCYLSVAAIIGDAYYCSHGGISPSFFARRHFHSIHKPILRATEHILIQDAVWADPAIGLRGTCFNVGRGSSSFFGLDRVCVAMETMNVRGFFRGHTVIIEGFENFYDVLYTIFTATCSSGLRNKGAVAVIDEKGHVSFRVLEIDPKREDYEERLRDYNGQVEDKGCNTTMLEVAPEHEVEETGAIKRMTNK